MQLTVWISLWLWILFIHIQLRTRLKALADLTEHLINIFTKDHEGNMSPGIRSASITVKMKSCIFCFQTANSGSMNIGLMVSDLTELPACFIMIMACRRILPTM